MVSVKRVSPTYGDTDSFPRGMVGQDGDEVAEHPLTTQEPEDGSILDPIISAKDVFQVPKTVWSGKRVLVSGQRSREASLGSPRISSPRT